MALYECNVGECISESKSFGQHKTLQVLNLMRENTRGMKYLAVVPANCLAPDGRTVQLKTIKLTIKINQLSRSFIYTVE